MTKTENVNQNQEQFRNLHCRMYKNKYPEEDQLVYATISEIIENGAVVSLLEYDNIQGMLFNNEITNLKAKKQNLLLTLGKPEVLRVLNVDVNKGYINLSKKTVKYEEEEMCKKNFSNLKKIENIIKTLSVKTQKTMKYLYKNIIWPLYDKYHHAYDALKSLSEGNDEILDGLIISDEIKEELIKIIEVKLRIEPVKIRSLFTLTCFTFNAIDEIKESLLMGEKKRTEEIQLKFNIIGSPLYECSVTTTKIKEGIKIINEALLEVKNNIRKRGGNFHMVEPPHVLNEKEKDIKEQMKEVIEKVLDEQEKEAENNEGIINLMSMV